MPIVGLSDRVARFPRLGIIRKGAIKTGNAPGKDLDYFRLDTKDEGIQAAFTQAYGMQPKQLSVLLPYQTTQENFECWWEEWTASCLRRRCDGEKQWLWLTQSGSYSRKPIPCLKEKKECHCTTVGRLHIVLPQIERMGYFELQTHSKWDIIGVNENLMAVEMSAGRLNGIPFLLKREMRDVTAPIGTDGKKARVKKSLLSIEVHPDTTSKLFAALQAKADRFLLGGDEVPLLAAAEEEF